MYDLKTETLTRDLTQFLSDVKISSSSHLMNRQSDSIRMIVMKEGERTDYQIIIGQFKNFILVSRRKKISCGGQENISLTTGDLKINLRSRKQKWGGPRSRKAVACGYDNNSNGKEV